MNAGKKKLAHNQTNNRKNGLARWNNHTMSNAVIRAGLEEVFLVHYGSILGIAAYNVYYRLDAPAFISNLAWSTRRLFDSSVQFIRARFSLSNGFYSSFLTKIHLANIPTAYYTLHIYPRAYFQLHLGDPAFIRYAALNRENTLTA